MIELSRRFRVLRVGLPLLGAIGVALLPGTSRAQCLPEKNADVFRNGDFISAPDSYNASRSFSAVIRRKKSDATETIIDWGAEYTPLDGSWNYSPYDPGYYHFIRVICENVDETPGSELLRMLDKDSKLPPALMGAKCSDKYKFAAPKPDSPEYSSHLSGGGHTPTVRLYKPSKAPRRTYLAPDQDPKVFISPVGIAGAHIVGYALTTRKEHPWQSEYNRRDSSKRYLAQSKTTSPGERGDWGNLFDGDLLRDFHVKNASGKYHFFTEVLYYYGDKYPDGTPIPMYCRYRAVRSDILEVDMASNLAGVKKTKPMVE